MQFIGLMLLGLLAGGLSGLTGIGGGIVVLPALFYFFKYSLNLAQGTTLAMLIPPIGLLAAFEYYRRGYVNITATVVLAIFFIIGSVFGAKLGLSISHDWLRRILATILMVVAVQMFFFSNKGGL